MGETPEIKRKYARFPAYSDAEGVKLSSTRKPFTSTEPWILTQAPAPTTTPTSEASEVDYTESEDLRARRRTAHVPKTIAKRYGHSIAQQDELKKHREHLPDYGKKPVREETKTGKVKLFGSYTRSSRPKAVPVEHEEPIVEDKTDVVSEKFVPTFTPESLIPEQPKEEATSDELLQAMKKPEASYLLFEEQEAYIEKKPEAAVVKRFNKQDTVSMTRGQYKAAIKSKDKKQSVLDRKLSGMIQEGQQETNSQSYFKD